MQKSFFYIYVYIYKCLYTFVHKTIDLVKSKSNIEREFRARWSLFKDESLFLASLTLFYLFH